jgi:quercetin dioxygenase-like cupin family protein
MSTFKDDSTMIEDRTQFDLTQEIADSEQKKPWQSGIYSKTLLKTHDMRIVLIAMENAARMKEHHTDGTISVQVIKGHLRFSDRGQTSDLRTGNVLALAASIKHDVESIGDSAFLLTIAWPDTQKLQAMKHRGYGS